MKLTTILIILGILGTLAAGAYILGIERQKEKETLPKFDVPLSASFALDNSQNVWEAMPVWRRNTFLGDYMTGIPIQIRKATQPTPADITAAVRLPAGILGKWECVAFMYVKQIRPVPIEEAPGKGKGDESFE